MKKILVINLGWEQEPLLDRLQNYDVEIYGIHYNKDYYKHVKYKDILICDLRDLETIYEFAKKINPDAVISDQCDYSYFAQSFLGEQFKLPSASVKNAQIATNKYIQRLVSGQKGIKIPKFQLCYCIDDIKKFVEENNFPVIVKPIDNRGSFGVNKITISDEIEYAFYDALKNSHSRFVLVEEFIDGTHITIDGYCFNGKPKSLGLALKKLSGDKYRQVALDILYSDDFFSEEETSYLYKLNEKVNNKLGFNFGYTHTEYMITENFEVYLIESANRGGGVYTSEIIVPAVSGINVLDQYISDVLRLNENYLREIQKNKVILKFFSFKPGKIKDIIINKEIYKNKNILKFKLMIKKGDVIHGITTDANRHGFIIVKNDNFNVESFIKKNIKVIYDD